MGNTRIKIKKNFLTQQSNSNYIAFNYFQSHHLGPSSSTTLSGVDKNKDPQME